MVELPNLDCGLCGFKTCAEMAKALEKNADLLKRCIHLSGQMVNSRPMTAPSCGSTCSPTCNLMCGANRVREQFGETSFKDSLGRDFDFYLEHFPDDPGPRELILPHNPMMTRELDVQVGDTLIGRPLSICGCSLYHCGQVVEVEKQSGVITWCVVGPLRARTDKTKDLIYYTAQGYDGLVYESKVPLQIGMRYWFVPRRCMLQYRHSGFLNSITIMPDGGYKIRLEGLWLG